MSFLLILLLVPFVVCFGPGLQILNALEMHSISLRGIVYIVASLHQHSECVYLGGETNIQEICLHTKLIIYYLHDRYTFTY